MVKRKTVNCKSSIISEYLSSNVSFLELEKKYGVKARTIQSWVRAFRNRSEEKLLSASSDELKVLKKQLEKEKLRSELLEEMLRLSEQFTGEELRKKFGTRQS